MPSNNRPIIIPENTGVTIATAVPTKKTATIPLSNGFSLILSNSHGLSGITSVIAIMKPVVSHCTVLASTPKFFIKIG